jgi:hypothetical protein
MVKRGNKKRRMKMYKKTINDHMTALGDVSSMFIVIEYNNPTYPETTVYNIAHGADLRLGDGKPNMLSDVMEGTTLVTYDNLKDAQKMCSRLNYGYETTKRLIATGSIQ